MIPTSNSQLSLQNDQGTIPFLDTFPRASSSVYRKPTHMDRYLDLNSNHPKSAKCAVVRTHSDRAKNVCSSPELLAKGMDHLAFLTSPVTADH